jgi:hypothetical protein
LEAVKTRKEDNSLNALIVRREQVPVVLYMNEESIEILSVPNVVN